MNNGYLLPIFSATLRKAADKVPSEKAPVKEKKRGRPIKIADEVVLEIRRLHELEGWTKSQIESKFPSIRPKTISQFLSYQTRGNLLLPRRK